MKIVVSIFFLLVTCFGIAQPIDSNAVQQLPPIVNKPIKKVVVKPKFIDTAIAKKNNDTANLISSDTSSLAVHNISTTDSTIHRTKDSLSYTLLKQYPILSNSKPFFMLTNYKQRSTTDLLFYVLLCVVLFFGIIRSIFPRYVKNIFGIIFQTKFRQVQTREQLVQDNVAATLLNILFIISVSLFISLLVYKNQIGSLIFWKMAGSSSLCLIVIYIIKLLFTRFMGWIFHATTAAKTYNFIVFIINKIIGIVIIPFLFLITFSSMQQSQFFIVLSLCVLSLLLLMRLFLTYKSISNILKMNAIHFFLYFCSLEILPLLLMYKAVSNYIGFGNNFGI